MAKDLLDESEIDWDNSDDTISGDEIEWADEEKSPYEEIFAEVDAEQTPPPLVGQPTPQGGSFLKDRLEDANAYLTGVGDQMTFDTSDELAAGLEKGIAKFLPESLGGMSKEAYDAVYGNRSIEDLAGAHREQKAALAKENPVAYGGGRLTGAVSQAALLRKVAPTGLASKLDTIPGLALEGAATGGLTALGGAEGSLEERLPSATKGALIGGGLGLGAGAIGRGLQKGTSYLADDVFPKLRDYFGLKTFGGTAKELGAAYTKKDVPRIVQEASKRGLLSPKLNFEDLVSEVGKRVNDVGGEIGSLLQKGDKAVASAPVNVARQISPTAGKLLKELEDDLTARLGNVSSQPYLKTVINDVQERLLSMPANQPVSLETMRQLKTALGQKGYGLRLSDSAAQEAFQTAERTVADRLSKSIGLLDEKGLLPNAKDSIKSLNQQFGDLATLKSISRNELGRRQGRLPVGLMEMGGALYGGLGSNKESVWDRGLDAIKFGVLAGGVRRYGNVTAYQGMSTLQKVLASGSKSMGPYSGVLKAAAAKGPTDLAVANFVLADKDPEYRRRYEEAQKEMDKDAGND